MSVGAVVGWVAEVAVAVRLVVWVVVIWVAPVVVRLMVVWVVMSSVPSGTRPSSVGVVTNLHLVLHLLVGQFLPNDLLELRHFLIDSLLNFLINNLLDALSDVEWDFVHIFVVAWAW